MLATISGTMLAPGVSKNGRLYTPEAIGKAVQRMRARISDDTARPIVMRSHHAAGDDTSRIVGHITAVTQDDTGAAKYEAVLNNTQAAQDILAAAGEQSLRNVSIYGWWGSDPKNVRHDDGQMVETSDDLEIDAVDFTAFPGVEQARIDKVTPVKVGKARESAVGRHVVTESVEAHLTTTAGVALSTSETRRADMLGESVIGECFACDDAGRAGFSINAHNGPISVNISAYDGIDPGELQAIATVAMQAACDALKALDPDMDADIDVDGAPNADTDGDSGTPAGEDDNSMESALPVVGINPKQLAEHLARIKNRRTPETTPKPPAPAKAAGTTPKEAAMPAESTAPVVEASSPARNLTDGDVAALASAMKEAFTAAMPAPAAPAPETAAPATPEATSTTENTAPVEPVESVAESTTKATAAAVREAVKQYIPELLEQYGLPPRRGYRTTAESSDDQPQPTTEELWANRSQVWDSVIPGGTPTANA